MDTLHSDLHGIVDRRDEVVSFDAVAGSVRPFARTAATETQPVATTAGAGWYHDAAIEAVRQDAIDARANPYHH